MKRALAGLIFLCMSLLLRGGDTLRIVFIGDVMQHKEQLKEAHIQGRDTVSADSYDYSSYFKCTAERFMQADLAVANMEFPCGAPPYRGYPAFSAPASLAAEAADAGIGLFLCANNHICDRGSKGIAATLSTYDSLGVIHTGLYRDSSDYAARWPLVMDFTGPRGSQFRVAFINFTYGTNGIRVPSPYVAAAMDTAQVRAAVCRAKEKGAEYVVALPHWGDEYQLTPSPGQRRWQQFLYGIGVDAIVGSHPHVMQPLEVEGGRVTLFSLGNFISNMSAVNTQAGWLFTLSLTRYPHGDVHLCRAEAEMIWCTRNRGPEDGWTTVVVDDFRECPEKFRSRAEYDKMMNTFVRLNTFFTDGDRR